ncbi:SDR family NAD(P)-dependent oxidoreductase [Membranihabitans marinus]|uniref:SDR family NAD(P)-dependent oxidoreductase n=1 Tax=Membranihabitans marinus TaxID=1227546 RepID=UPI001F3ABCB7|nr:SDR family NAD(P)-dependent oxidoreductase [Membranihabitans marinus]
MKNQTAIITGAAKGLGLAIAQKLADSGTQLILIDMDGPTLEKVAQSMPNVIYTQAMDITDETAVEDMVKEVSSITPHIHILVNSAGITGQTNIKSHLAQKQDVERVMGVNFYGSWYLSKYVLPFMLDQKYGRILHIASIAGKEGNAGMLAYSASKAAVIGMTKVQGKEYAGTGITVNAIAPAVIQTAMVDQMPAEQVKYMTDKIPMQRCGTLDELSALAAFIVSPDNSFTTGFTFDLSGGRATY